MQTVLTVSVHSAGNLGRGYQQFRISTRLPIRVGPYRGITWHYRNAADSSQNSYPRGITGSSSVFEMLQQTQYPVA